MDMLERGFDGGLPCHPGRFDHLCLRSTEGSVPEKVSQTLTAFHPTPELARAVWSNDHEDHRFRSRADFRPHRSRAIRPHEA